MFIKRLFINVLAITSLLGRSFRGHFFLCFWIGRVVRVWSKVLETAVAALGPFFMSRGPYKIGDSVRISHVNLAKHWAEKGPFFQGLSPYLKDRVPLGKPHWKRRRVYLGIAQMGGGSQPLPKWFGAPILRRIVHVQRGICLVWGVWTLAKMVLGTYAVKIEVPLGIFFC